MGMLNTNKDETQIPLSYTAWRDQLDRDIPDTESVKDHVFFQVSEFEKRYQKNHGNELVERVYSNDKSELLRKLTKQTYTDLRDITPIMIMLQHLAYHEFQKTKDFEANKKY
ncbi:MAG: hypothetical protein GOU98_03085 [Candidatus Altiarchaeota archaeon]|nr:hypothetical protein [Candidatus Altiarchaeota archaeon]